MTQVLHAYIHLLHNSVQKKRKNNVHVLYNRVEGWQRTISTFFFFTTVCKGAANMEQRERERERERVRERDWKARCNSDSTHGKGYFSQSPLSLQTIFRNKHNPCVLLHASTSVRMLKIPNTSSHTIVWTHKTLQTLTGMGSTALVAAVTLPG